MKIKSEHYNTLRDCMLETSKHPLIIDLKVSGGLTDLQFVWRWFFATPIENQRPEAWMCKTLYSYMNDNHLETALKKILRDSELATESTT